MREQTRAILNARESLLNAGYWYKENDQGLLPIELSMLAEIQKTTSELMSIEDD